MSKELATPSRRELDHEAELVRGAKARSPEAWTEIYEQNYPKLFRYVQARVADRETAEDLTATVFMEALKSIDSYASRGRPLLAWLYRIALNVVNYHYRSLFRRKAGHGVTEALGAGLGRLIRTRPADEGQQELLATDSSRRSADPAGAAEQWDLREAIDRLSGDQREVIILRYFVGLSTPETAKVVGKGERAVYSLQARAIKALRRHLC